MTDCVEIIKESVSGIERGMEYIAGLEGFIRSEFRKKDDL